MKICMRLLIIFLLFADSVFSLHAFNVIKLKKMLGVTELRSGAKGTQKNKKLNEVLIYQETYDYLYGLFEGLSVLKSICVDEAKKIALEVSRLASNNGVLKISNCMLEDKNSKEKTPVYISFPIQRFLTDRVGSLQGVREIILDTVKFKGTSSYSNLNYSLTDAFKGLKNLTKLTIRACDLTGDQIEQILAALRDLPALKELSIYANESLKPASFESLSSSHLTSLAIRSCDLWGSQPSIILTALGKLQDFEKLDLSVNDLSQVSPGLFKGLTKLTELNIGYCKIKGAQLNDILEDLSGLSALKKLTIRGNDFNGFDKTKSEELTKKKIEVI